MTTTKNIVFRLLLVLFLGLFAELVSFGAMAFLDGQVFSYKRLSSEREALQAATTASVATPEDEALELLGQSPAEQEVLHPYLGWVFDPSLNVTQGRLSRGMLRVTEEGFLTDPGVAAELTGDEIIIGVFGGSVAFVFCFQGKDTLIEELHKVPAFAERRIVVRCYALGSFKQPQQQLALNYLLALDKRFDYVVNLDGFNDIVLPVVDNVPQGLNPFYPRGWTWRVEDIPDPAVQQRVGQIAYLRESRRERARFFSRAVLSHSVTFNLVWRALDRSLANDIAAIQIEVLGHQAAEKSFLAHGPKTDYGSDSELFLAAAGLWRRSSLAMAELCRAKGIHYYHFLQPNQYVPDSKPMGREERKRGFLESHPYRMAVRKGYPYLVEAGRELVAEGVEFHDLRLAFSGVREPLYSDSCCHFNVRGNEIVAIQVARAMIADLDRDSSRAKSADDQLELGGVGELVVPVELIGTKDLY